MKYQLTCPKCRHEFAYDNGHIDQKIAGLRSELADIGVKLERFKRMNSQIRRKHTELRDALQIRKAEIVKELTELKAFRKVADQQIKSYEYLVFKELVKERYGEAVYKDLLKKTDAELAAYKASGLMRHEYSRKGGATVTSINKI